MDISEDDMGITCTEDVSKYSDDAADSDDEDDDIGSISMNSFPFRFLRRPSSPLPAS
jgi:hypothetical protein